MRSAYCPPSLPGGRARSAARVPEVSRGGAAAAAGSSPVPVAGAGRRRPRPAPLPEPARPRPRAGAITPPRVTGELRPDSPRSLRSRPGLRSPSPGGGPPRGPSAAPPPPSDRLPRRTGCPERQDAEAAVFFQSSEGLSQKPPVGL
ncbi:nascent polypeptide-associated complex subunit alpha, muscle-specific form-like [Harpia harpyja]|uniref:nascent polypeptide-associated complex subunit alpha, muscle-specific form-like n=1 Tax=Harpia harpyja TaxID=202280 RepID=UPI0022B1B815|nr:nascent polypeptide-associated complex subunit alpha, muscle-specific form-like [Harpia harpyja]